MSAPTAIQYQVLAALRACEEKKAENISILRMDKNSGAFTDYFVLCTGTNPRQIQAIADGVDERLHIAGLTPAHTEGYRHAEWVLLDYIDFVVHIFSEHARKYYDLERLWKSAERITAEEVLLPPKQAAKPTPVRSAKWKDVRSADRKTARKHSLRGPKKRVSSKRAKSARPKKKR